MPSIWNTPICVCCPQSRAAVGYAVSVAPDMPIRCGACVTMMDSRSFTPNLPEPWQRRTTNSEHLHQRRATHPHRAIHRSRPLPVAKRSPRIDHLKYHNPPPHVPARKRPRWTARKVAPCRTRATPSALWTATSPWKMTPHAAVPPTANTMRTRSLGHNASAIPTRTVDLPLPAAKAPDPRWYRGFRRLGAVAEKAKSATRPYISHVSPDQRFSGHA